MSEDFIKIELHKGIEIGDTVIVTRDGKEQEVVITMMDSDHGYGFVANELNKIKNFFNEYKVSLMKSTLNGFELSVVSDDNKYVVNLTHDGKFDIRPLTPPE